MNYSSNLWWFATLCWWCLASLCLIFDINYNIIQQYPPLSFMETLMLPLLSLSFYFSPPLTSMEEGTPPDNISWCVGHNLFSTDDYADQFGETITPSICQRYSKVSLGRGLVKIFAIYCFVPMYSNLMFFPVTFSYKKQNLIGICFVLECITRFLEMFIELVLSQSIRMGSSPICIVEFASSKEPEYNMLFLQYIMLLLWIRILKITSYSTRILKNHPSRRSLHLYFFYHQYFLPSLHLCRKLESNHFLLDTKSQNMLFF